MPDISINISANTVAWYAAIVSSIMLLFTAWSHWSDRAVVKLSVVHGMKIHPETGRNMTKTYTILKVCNHGRRPIYVSHAAVKYRGEEGAAMFPDSLAPTLLQEGQPKSYILEEKSDDQHTILRYEITDSLGNIYTCKPNFHDT